MAERKDKSESGLLPLGRAGVLVTQAVTRFRDLEPGRRNRLLTAAAILLGCFAALLWFSTRTEWRVLYSGLEPEDMRQMGQELTAAGIPYDVSQGSALLVPSENLDKARLIATVDGGPKSGRMGFELFDKPNWMGSEFDEKVNYQRALEGELEHTIGTLKSVESARVHLVLPHDSLFSGDQHDAKGAVVLRLRHGAITDDEVQGIANLVAGAVEGLNPKNVVVINAEGGGLLGPQTPDAVRASREQALTQKLMETLEPAAGAGNVRATVSVDYSATSADEVDENYDPTQSATLSMQSTEQTSAEQAASGVPGTASNTPNGKPPLYPSPAPTPQTLKQQSATYAVSNKVRHTVESAGSIRRLSAAVLINYRRSGSGAQAKWQPRSPAEMSELLDLARAAVGFDASRGDQISLEELSFDTNSASPRTTVPQRFLAAIPQYSILIRYATVLLGMLGFFLFVVRPAVRWLAAASPTRGAAGASAFQTRPGLLADSEAPEPDVRNEAADQKKLRAQSIFEQVADHVKRDPSQSTRLLESWIRSE